MVVVTVSQLGREQRPGRGIVAKRRGSHPQREKLDLVIRVGVGFSRRFRPADLCRLAFLFLNDRIDPPGAPVRLGCATVNDDEEKITRFQLGARALQHDLAGVADRQE